MNGLHRSGTVRRVRDGRNGPHGPPLLPDRISTIFTLRLTSFTYGLMPTTPYLPRVSRLFSSCLIGRGNSPFGLCISHTSHAHQNLAMHLRTYSMSALTDNRFSPVSAASVMGSWESDRRLWSIFVLRLGLWDWDIVAAGNSIFLMQEHQSYYGWYIDSCSLSVLTNSVDDESVLGMIAFRGCW